MDRHCLSVESDVQSLGQLDGQLVVAFPTTEVRPGELKVIVLVPVLERELGERSCIGKLKVGKVPVEDLTIAGRKVDGTVRNEKRTDMK